MCVLKSFQELLHQRYFYFTKAWIFCEDSKLFKLCPPIPVLGPKMGSKFNIEICRKNIFKMFFLGIILLQCVILLRKHPQIQM